MIQGIFRDAHPFTKLLLVGFVMVSCYLALFGISLVGVFLGSGTRWDVIRHLIEMEHYEGHLGLLKFLQMGYSTGLFLIPALLAAWLISGKPFNYLGLDERPSVNALLLVALVMISAVPLNNLVSQLNYSIPLPDWLGGMKDRILENDRKGEAMMEAFLDQKTTGGFITNLVMIAVIPSLGEEFIFRGTVQRIFTEWSGSRHLGAWIGAVCFSLMHFQFFGFVPRVLLGAALGYMFIWSRSLWLPVLAHFINNSMAVVAFHLYYNGKLQFNPDIIGSGDHALWYVFFSIVLVLVGMGSLHALRKRG